MKMKLPRGFKTFAKKHSRRVKARREEEGNPVNFYNEQTGEYSTLKVHTDSDGKSYLEIYDGIGWWITEQDVAAAIRDFDGDELEIRMNCPGGDVFMGLAIADILSSHPAKCVGRIHGICASISTAISLGCDEVEITTGSQYMVHPASMLMYANASEARELADWLDKTTQGIIDLYEERTTIDRAEIERLVEAETFMSAKEAVAAGFVDRVVKLKSAKKDDAPTPEPEPEPDNSAAMNAQAKRQRMAKAMAIKGGRFQTT